MFDVELNIASGSCAEARWCVEKRMERSSEAWRENIAARFWSVMEASFARPVSVELYDSVVELVKTNRPFVSVSPDSIIWPSITELKLMGRFSLTNSVVRDPIGIPRERSLMMFARIDESGTLISIVPGT